VTNLPSVSVIIPVLNGASTIGDTLAGLTHQLASPCDTEIIVVDNGSSDGTPDLVQKFPVTLLGEPKRGPSAARNRGLYAARGEIIAYLDADTLPTRRWLVEIVSPFLDPEIHLVAGRLMGYRPETPAEKFYSRFYVDREQKDASATHFPFAPSANMAVRRSAALAIGGWDEEFRVAQDMEFSYRLLREFKTNIHYQPSALVFLRTRPTDSDLYRQAFKYGQGRAKLWMRYPDVARWNAIRAIGIASRLAIIGMWPLVASAAKTAGRASEEDVLFAKYYRSWNYWSWRGFATMLHHNEWRLD